MTTPRRGRMSPNEPEMDRIAFFALADGLPHADLAELLDGGGLVVIAPHPDDESLGCGALIARAAAANIPIRIVVVSDGCMSHPNSRLYPRLRLRATRQAEARAAARALGLAESDVRFLDLPDAAVPAAGPVAEAAIEGIVGVAREVSACSLFVTWRHDAHCDHQVAYALARAAQGRLGDVRLLEYSIWGRDAADPAPALEPPRGWRLYASAERERKRTAILAHASQVSGLIGDDPDGFTLPPEMIADCLVRDELFLEMQP